MHALLKPFSNTTQKTFTGSVLVSVCCALLLSLFPISSHAQLQTPNTGDILVLTLFPQSPAAYQVVQAKVSSFSINLNQAKVAWFFNDKLVQEGAGHTTFSFRTGAVGTVSKLRVEVTNQQGLKATETLDVRPAYVAIGWEADTYTPPLYQGKALYAPGAVFTATAFPVVIGEDGVSTPASSLVYRWYKDGKLQDPLSGLNRQKISFIHAEYIRPFTIKVEILTTSNQILATGEEYITVVQPEMLVYESFPLLGVRYDKAIGARHTLTSEEGSLLAEPYYFNATTRYDSSLSYQWEIRGEPAGNTPNVTLRPAESAGIASLQITVRHLSKILQSARKAFTVQFTGSTQ